jgi:ubiquinone biosynthesis protein COQ9
VRLELLQPHREAVRRGIAFLALPANVALGTRLLYRTVDAIWYAAGDTATDYNFYTKRALLAGVYASTLLYWLDDASDGYADTWAFLDRRIADAMRIPQAVGRFGKAGSLGGVGDVLSHVPSPWRVLQRVARERRARYPAPPSRPMADAQPDTAPDAGSIATPGSAGDTGHA